MVDPKVKRAVPRYAIYYAPEPGSALHAFGESWFNGAAARGSRLDRAKVSALTEGPRLYGFHGTLKPPFELGPTFSEAGLVAAARVFAKGVAPIEIPPLELAVIGKFIALSPTEASAPLEKLAAACVRAFEGFRIPLTESSVRDYRRNKLTVHQEQMLEHWGYPYVMEEFRFHMSLTDRIEDNAERELVLEELQKLAAPILGKPVAITALTLFVQFETDAPLKPFERIPFGRTG
jgi:hypothetical protein